MSGGNTFFSSLRVTATGDTQLPEPASGWMDIMEMSGDEYHRAIVVAAHHVWLALTRGLRAGGRDMEPMVIRWDPHAVRGAWLDAGMTTLPKDPGDERHLLGAKYIGSLSEIFTLLWPDIRGHLAGTRIDVSKSRLDNQGYLFRTTVTTLLKRADLLQNIFQGGMQRLGGNRNSDPPIWWVAGEWHEPETKLIGTNPFREGQYRDMPAEPPPPAKQIHRDDFPVPVEPVPYRTPAVPVRAVPVLQATVPEGNGGTMCRYPGCEERFRSIVRLREHEIAHIGIVADDIDRAAEPEADGIYRCPACRATATNAANLRAHEDSSHPKLVAARPYHCLYPGCRRTFDTMKGVGMHTGTGHGLTEDERRLLRLVVAATAAGDITREQGRVIIREAATAGGPHVRTAPVMPDGFAVPVTGERPPADDPGNYAAPAETEEPAGGGLTVAMYERLMAMLEEALGENAALRTENENLRRAAGQVHDPEPPPPPARPRPKTREQELVNRAAGLAERFNRR